jgi:hypothetical protein
MPGVAVDVGSDAGGGVGVCVDGLVADAVAEATETGVAVIVPDDISVAVGDG